MSKSRHRQNQTAKVTQLDSDGTGTWPQQSAWLEPLPHEHDEDWRARAYLGTTGLHFLSSGGLRSPERSSAQSQKNKITFLVHLSSWLKTFLPPISTGNYFQDVWTTFWNINRWALSYLLNKTAPARQSESFTPCVLRVQSLLFQCRWRERSQSQAFKMPHGGYHNNTKRSSFFCLGRGCIFWAFKAKRLE